MVPRGFDGSDGLTAGDLGEGAVLMDARLVIMCECVCVEKTRKLGGGGGYGCYPSHPIIQIRVL